MAVSVGVGVTVEVNVGRGVLVGGHDVAVGRRVEVVVGAPVGVAAESTFCSWRVKMLLPRMVQIKMMTMPPPISNCRSSSVSGTRVGCLSIAVAPIRDHLFFLVKRNDEMKG